jgi:predicted transcriptional regulator
MDHVTKVAKALRSGRNQNQGKGLTASQLAKKAGINRDAVYRAVYELRNAEEGGMEVFRNSRITNGRKKYYYRVAA